MTKTPIFDFVGRYANGDTLRMHMPGHKGMGVLGVEAFDITEIDGADVLYNADGIIKQSECIASELFGSAQTLYSTEGSSLSIRAMVYLVSSFAKAKGQRPLIAAGRNAHRAFLSAVALTDADVCFMYPKNMTSVVSCELTADDVENYILGCEHTPTAVYITSPDYLGNTADIGGIAEVCHKYGVLFLVDNAHGAYLRFLPQDAHPLSLGADLVCDSAHKTLPVLTGGAYLHIGKNAPCDFCDQAEEAMALFASTSPSYLILSSLDLANKYITDGYRERLADFIVCVDEMKRCLTSHGYVLVGNEPLKLSIDAKKYGYLGTELAEKLRDSGIECEFADADFTVMMLSCELGEESLLRLEKALLSIEKCTEKLDEILIFSNPIRKMTVREAMFAPSELVRSADAVGRVFASAAISCPPAISPIVAGEVIDEASVRVLKYCGIDRVRVVKI